jgi:tRNA 2-selenouridine synthase
LGDAYSRRFVVLRGNAGVGKTAVLRALADRGHRVLDLETMAGHRGSAFGRVGLPAQPGAREFASRISATLAAAAGATIYAEAEGMAIGGLAVPPELARVLAAADYVLLRDTLERRIARITVTYRSEPRAELIEAVARLEARVGRAAAARAQRALLHDDVEQAVAALLPYYDRAYAHQLEACGGRLLTTIDATDRTPAQIAEQCTASASAV